MLRRLVDAYAACQMEQGRVIDSLYGTLSGRDKSFREQVLSLLDLQKEQTLTEVVNKLNPNSCNTSDEDPYEQFPHIYSSYLIAIGEKIGLRGVKAARLDQHALPIDDFHTNQLYQLFWRLFSVSEFIDCVINDVNQQDKEADRLLDRDLLFQWAGSQKGIHFDPFCVCYDEDSPQDYKGAPTPDNKYQPFLNKKSALVVLIQLFLPSETIKGSPNVQTQLDAPNTIRELVKVDSEVSREDQGPGDDSLHPPTDEAPVTRSEKLPTVTDRDDFQTND